MGALLTDLTALFSFIILFAAIAISSEQICIDKNTTVDTCLQQGVNISCPSGSVIYRPDIKAASEPCNNKNPSCKEKTVELIVDTSKCYWKQRCTIRFPTTPLLKCFTEVESLYIHNWQCVDMTNSPHTYVGQICDSKKDLGSNIKQGIIRSHDNIPWLYGKDTFTDYLDTTLTARCTKTIHLRPGADERFLVSVDLMNIDEDNDHFSINGVQVSNTSYQREFSAADTKIVFSFTSDPATTKGGSGFLICFKRLNVGERGAKNMSACDGVISTANHANQPVDMIQTTHDFCLKKKRIHKLVKERDIDKACKQMMSLYHISTQMPVSYTQLSTETPVISNKFCTKCLKRTRLGKKCKRKCCKGKDVPNKCTKAKGKKCNLRGKRLDKLCKKCENATKCKRKFIKRCNSCCGSHKNILSKCKKSKKKTNKRRKNRKGSRGKGRKNLSKNDKKKKNQ
ncbi:unnamed protein product [Mytilus coruscus]|uniref:CUB domain-containing protein n=1 Tax=Mytilus coruscus TaxID=42192 RepID=A0A6J8D9D7_MYTCO|nr:unnamed protein product [Mytilus coruscus]